MAFEVQEGGFTLNLGGRTILRHAPETPVLFIGRGDASIAMHHGHFDIEDYVIERVALRHAEIRGDKVYLSTSPASPAVLALRIDGNETDAAIAFEALDPAINRIWIRVVAEPGEHVWGGGEQLSYFDMAGRRFPLWTSEPGVGRDKSTLITWQADRRSNSGGDYYRTNYPQPTYVSSRRYALHVETTAWSAFDFRREGFHEIEVWDVPARIELWARPHFSDLVMALSDRFGKQPPLPEWVYDGAIIGLKDGENSFDRLEKYGDAGVAVSGLWCEDWAGLRETSFGRRLFWDWQYNAARYPDLPKRIAALAARGIRFLAYVNPYLCVDGSLYPEAEKAGYFAKKLESDETYLVDFGEFDCGVVDFTNPEASQWFAEHVIARNMLDLGIMGWMADFGEYLPTDIRLASGKEATLAHNEWPVLWAEVNARAVASRGKTGDAIFFMRAGYSGVQRYCPLLWAGDQSVDFSRHDGIGTVICAALSSGLVGNAFHHSDVGGYTSLFDNVRTPELLMRWAEMAAFTPVMRGHEGNRPLQNLQIDQDPEVLAHFARMTRIYVHLAPYLRMLSREAAETGLPVQRPLFLHFEDDARTYGIQTAYLYGPDLLVAPVIEADRSDWTAYLPAGAEWVHVWSGKRHAGGQDVTVPAPFGEPPVFYRADSAHADLFERIASVR
ncbi:alpha-glucosidase [Sphingosinicella microcystinivorans]|uniref:alpha-glucosidase n=1 Tax=Sphingosinicella microcystinivorans TaxID=335406 RepID=UPI0022F383A9|nr:alpha-glucosidase [Sphingosinicella microcystinivorans]WBX84519.1 alpha-glucosidase [Sphingosinicella microcystinivorans]